LGQRRSQVNRHGPHRRLHLRMAQLETAAVGRLLSLQPGGKTVGPGNMTGTLDRGNPPRSDGSGHSLVGSISLCDCSSREPRAKLHTHRSLPSISNAPVARRIGTSLRPGPSTAWASKRPKRPYFGTIAPTRHRSGRNGGSLAGEVEGWPGNASGRQRRRPN
jgi:hypothetical protein